MGDPTIGNVSEFDPILPSAMARAKQASARA
jgi:hypothetical protein